MRVTLRAMVPESPSCDTVASFEPLPPDSGADPTAQCAAEVISALRLAATPSLGLQAALNALRRATTAQTALFASDSTPDASVQPVESGQWRITHLSSQDGDSMSPDAPRATDARHISLLVLGEDPPDSAQFTWRGTPCLWLTVRVRLFGRIGLLLISEATDAPPMISLAQTSLQIIGAMLELDKLHRHVLEQVPCDPLSHFLNPQGFREEATRRFNRLDWQTLSATLLVIHCPGLSDILSTGNDHEGADAIRQTADVLKRSARPTDVFGRLGSESFVILMDGCDRFAAAERAEKMTTHGLPLLLETPKRLPMQIGLLEREPNSRATIDDLITVAENALRRAKREGKSWLFAAETG